MRRMRICALQGLRRVWLRMLCRLLAHLPRLQLWLLRLRMHPLQKQGREWAGVRPVAAAVGRPAAAAHWWLAATIAGNCTMHVGVAPGPAVPGCHGSASGSASTTGAEETRSLICSCEEAGLLRARSCKLSLFRASPSPLPQPKQTRFN